MANGRDAVRDSDELPAGCQWLDLPNRSDQRGGLVAIEAEDDIPFPIRRAYYLFATASGAERGFHAHQKLRQLIICVSGECSLLLDDGTKRQTVRLERPDRGVVINATVWREMRDFTDDCVLLVLASEPYEENDYIRDYEEFRHYVSR